MRELVGTSSAMRELRAKLARIADSDASVLVTGESGTGKELVARAIHAASRRAHGPFVAINCAAMPAQLLESELFGHTRGAFTDATADKPGLFQAANGGTLFLDEIAELPRESQPKLLRVLQERAVRPIGATAEIRVDTRVIAATNRDLERMTVEQHFREDLYFRIHVFALALPPLRERRDDIPALAARAGRRISPAAMELLLAYHWPGNVRELENCLEYACALAGEEILPGDLPDRLRAPPPVEPFVTLDEHERRYVLRVLESAEGNKAAAARVLGIERRTLYRMLERWGMS